MLKIAVVDDDKKFMAIYKQIIANLFSEHHVKTEINDFFSGKEFIKSLLIKMKCSPFVRQCGIIEIYPKEV